MSWGHQYSPSPPLCHAPGPFSGVRQPGVPGVCPGGATGEGRSEPQCLTEAAPQRERKRACAPPAHPLQPPLRTHPSPPPTCAQAAPQGGPCPGAPVDRPRGGILRQPGCAGSPGRGLLLHLHAHTGPFLPGGLKKAAEQEPLDSAEDVKRRRRRRSRVRLPAPPGAGPAGRVPARAVPLPSTAGLGAAGSSDPGLGSLVCTPPGTPGRDTAECSSLAHPDTGAAMEAGSDLSSSSEAEGGEEGR